MMQMLLEITTTPTKYELQIEHARLEYNQEFIPRAKVETTQPEVRIQTKPTELRLDTYEARRSLGFAKVADIVQDGTEKCQKNFEQYVQTTVQEGKQMAAIEEGMTINQIISQRMLNRSQLETYTAFLPSTGAAISWEPGQIRLDAHKGELNYDWQIKSNILSYVPGSVRMKILERGGVDIEYVGSPIYIPKSADPNYEEPVAG